MKATTDTHGENLAVKIEAHHEEDHKLLTKLVENKNQIEIVKFTKNNETVTAIILAKLEETK